VSTPNRPGNRPVPASEQAEQPRQTARPQPATRPGAQPPARPGAQPPARPGGQPPARSGAQSPAERPAGRPQAGAGAPPQGAGRPQATTPPTQARPVQGPPPQAPRPAAERAPEGRPTPPQPPRPAEDRPASAPKQESPAEDRARTQPPTEAAAPVDQPFDPLRAEDVAPPTAAFQNTQGGSAPANGAAQSSPPWQRGASQRGPAQQGAATQADPHQTGRPQNLGAPQNPGAPQNAGAARNAAQNQPQTNLSARGGALPSTGPVASAPVTQRSGAAYPDSESPEDKTQRREAAKSKAAGIDGPTRHIERKDLARDMPDLSEVRHPEPTAETQQVAQPVAIAAREGGEPLRATIQLRKIDPWSTLKISLVIAVSLFFVWMVAVGLLYAVLDGMGVWDRLNSAFTDIVSESGDGGLVSAGQVFGYAAVIGIINVVLFTALTTIGSFIYNLSSDLVGGVEVTLADRD
jgi:hypothetical protein